MTAEEQAVVLVNEVRAEREQELWKGVGDRRGYGIVLEALCRAIEQHEAYQQKVSDAVGYVIKFLGARHWAETHLKEFIIPAPKPDPLVDVAESLGYFNTAAQGWAGDVRAALEARGLEIREKGQ
jgi:hypothetical protein